MEIIISGKTVLIDKEDWSKLSKHAWHIETNHGYVVYRDSKRHKFYLHRLILNSPVGKIIDHKNRNKLDNRKSNLRISSSRRNVLNQDWSKGISQLKNGKWRAYVTITGKDSKKQLHLGQYDSEYEANLVTKTARLVLERVYSTFNL